MKYPVNEIFYSIQGEGYHTGTPAVFIRLSGCNLTCTFCDTNHIDHSFLTLNEITGIVRGLSSEVETIVLTGGEPTLFDLNPIVETLHADGFRIHLETNGTKPVNAPVDWITCSPKRQGSSNDYYIDSSLFESADEVKIVFQDRAGIEETASLFKTRNLFLQPCSGANVPETVSYILSHPWWRLSLQTHKLIDIP